VSIKTKEIDNNVKNRIIEYLFKERYDDKELKDWMKFPSTILDFVNFIDSIEKSINGKKH